MKLLISILSLFVVSCIARPPGQSNVIIVAVENLGVNQVNCLKETDSHSGLSLLCQEAVRLTHAYTTSPLALPALTSVLTGLYPSEHGLRHHGNNSLSPQFETIAEAAQKNQIATSLFSGGAPLLRKQLLHQGFDLFDDSFSFSSQSAFRPFQKSVQSFQLWLKEIRQTPYLTVFYVPDLLHDGTPTITDFGKQRASTFESQLEEFDESLLEFILFLKSNHQWDKTTFILVGLNGPTNENSVKYLNLRSESTHVAMLMKPENKPRDSGINWSFDAYVSLVDIGHSLQKKYNPSFETKVHQLPTLDLFSTILSQSGPTGNQPRPLLIESSWGTQEEGLQPTYAIRLDQFLFILEDHLTAYNSLIDKAETIAISLQEGYLKNPLEAALQLIQEKKLISDRALSPDGQLKWEGLGAFYNKIESARLTDLQKLAFRLRDDAEVSHNYILSLLMHNNWDELEKWALSIRDRDLELIARRNLSKPTNWKEFNDFCLSALDKNISRGVELKKCEDPGALALIEWIQHDRSYPDDFATKETLKKKFLRYYFQNKLDQALAQKNWTLKGPWDLSRSLRGKTSTLDLMLAHPSALKYKLIVSKIPMPHSENRD